MTQTGPAPLQEVAAESSGRPLWLNLGLAALALVAVYFLAREVGSYVPLFAEWVRELGFWGPLVFIGGYAVLSTFVPGAFLTLAGGAIFGLVRGTVFVFVAAVLGSTVAFLVARYFARAAMERRLHGNERFSAINNAVADQGLKVVFLLRLSPVFPFILLNYALGLTRVRLKDYLLASLGMIPGTLLYVYYGWIAGDLAALAGGAGIEKDTSYYAAQVVGLAITIGVTAYVTRIARRALAAATNEPPQPEGPTSP